MCVECVVREFRYYSCNKTRNSQKKKKKKTCPTNNFSHLEGCFCKSSQTDWWRPAGHGSHLHTRSPRWRRPGAKMVEADRSVGQSARGLTGEETAAFGDVDGLENEERPPSAAAADEYEERHRLQLDRRGRRHRLNLVRRRLLVGGVRGTVA